ncbi:mitochondrial assembly of ribosomal large subunit protein 1 [Arapaima gigas]
MSGCTCLLGSFRRVLPQVLRSRVVRAQGTGGRVFGATQRGGHAWLAAPPNTRAPLGHGRLGCGVRRYSGTAEAEEAVDQRRPRAFTLDVVVALLRQENAADVCVINVPTEMKYVDYFIVVSGSSTRHLVAMAEYALKVYKSMKTDTEPHVKIEGRNTDDWLCIDFGHIVVHFMLPETRDLYELEKLWTLRTFDEQLSLMPTEMLPEDFIYEDKSKDWRSGFGEGGGVEHL